MKLSHLLRGSLLVFALSFHLAASEPVKLLPQEAFASALAKIADLFEPAEEGVRTARATLEFVEAEGLPKGIVGNPIEVMIQAPERLRIKMQVDKEIIQLGRDGQQVWILQPGKKFGVVATAGVPRFAMTPGSLDDTELEPISLPIERAQFILMALMFQCEDRPAETIDGESCRVIHAVLAPRAREVLKTGAVELTIALRESDLLPMRIDYSDGGKTHAQIVMREFTNLDSVPDSDWQMPAAPDAKVERVALSHIQRFFPAAIDVATTKSPTLGPVTGEKKLVARFGRGRLEMHDGTRVLFLAGSPEEMGEQHGRLMKKQVRDLVNRVLYGVGVGSSFEKGEWFFGTIERCQGRIGKYIDERYLREMDALARGAGIAPQEVRLANFFPELFHCSGFALTGSATQGGRIFHGRILDYMKGIGLEPNATVIVQRPDYGHAWVNIAYAGFVGSVTAMNDQHISIGEMGGRGEGQWDGKPMAQLLREVMENASTLDEAIEIMRRGPRTCEYYYVIADGKTHTAIGIKATPDIFEIVHPGEAHPQLKTPVKDTVLLSAGDRYDELVARVKSDFGKFDAESARNLMTRPVCMTSNIHSVLFAPDTLDFWVANADSQNVASHTRYTQYNLGQLLKSEAPVNVSR